MSTIAPSEPYPVAQPDTNPDDNVRSEVLNALHHNSGVPQDAIRVEVSQGHVTLSGSLDKDFEVALAERLAKTAPGVVKVTNNISLRS